ncbi:hypothetical protein [Halomonas sp. 141]|uniref:hypothetical protein n=1 Tax=Halomonas sp. 141 TaxID=2056666 RepID=UPI001E5F6CAF|nr:hypothetical protein [Halomonas sp. 141]
MLAEGTPLASIALEIANGAQGGDATGLQNKVTLANQFTALVASGEVAYDGADAAAYGRAFLATINENTNVENYDVQAVVDAIESGVLPVDTADLRSALEELREAEQAIEDFLAAALDNEDVAAVVNNDTAEAATRADIEGAVTATQNALVDELGIDQTEFASARANTKAGLIADERAERQKAIEDAQDDLDAANAAINAISGLRVALNNYTNAVAASEAADAALASAAADADGAEVAFANRNDAYDVAGISYEDAEGPVATRADATLVVVNNETVLQLNAQGQYVIPQGLPVADYPGLSALQAALQAEKAASTTAATALQTQQARETTFNNIELTTAQEEALIAAGFTGDLDAAGIAGTISGLEGAVEAAQNTLTDLNEAVAAWEAVVALEAELTSLEEAREAAFDAINDSVEDGGLGFTLLTLADDATDANDVFLFADDVANPASIDNFGDAGVDRIFFGPDYKLVQLAEGETINDRVGSASDLEIFWSQGDTGLQLFVEAGAEAGRDLNDDNITTITLTGVNAEDISFTSGFLAAGSIA